MRGEYLVAALGLLHGHRDFFFRHRRFFGAHAGDLLAGEIELDRVDAVFDELAHRTAHLFGSGDDDAEIEAFVRDMRWRGVAEPAYRRNFRTGRQIARTGK